MKRLNFALSLLSAPLDALAGLCSHTAVGVPCIPDPGPATDEAKQKILDLIAAAQAAEPKVVSLRAAYVAIRGTAASDEEKLAAAQAYFAVYTTQEQAYQKAMTLTADLYEVKPNHRDSLIIGAPSDPADGYVTGLTARWNPRATDSGPNVMLSVKIVGKDGKAHYSGATKMDPRTPGDRLAVTLLDGRVLILKDSFALAMEKGNPGYLARIIYHETRHFDRLAWTDSAGERRGWQDNDKEERDAYKRDLDYISAFGLAEDDVKEIRRNYNDYAAAVRKGVPLTDNTLTPAEEEKWKNHYTGIQVNIEEEFTRLAEKVAAERARQRALQRRIEEERLAHERQAAERRARENEAAVWRQLDQMAASCSYRIAYQERTGNFLGFKDENGYFFFIPSYKTTLRLNDVEVALLVSRACGQVREIMENRRSRPSPACNDSAALLGRAVATPGFSAKLDYMFGPRSMSNRCIYDLFDRAADLTDSTRFDKFVGSYAKQRKKEAEEEDRRWNPRKPQRDTPRRGEDSPPRDERTRTSPDHDEVWRRINPILK